MVSAILVLVGMTAACAPSRQIEVIGAGQTSATEARTYVLSLTETASPEENSAARAVERQLQARRWASVSSSAEWKIETAYVVRAESTGVIRHDDATEVWLVQPERRAWWRRKSSIHALSVRLVKPATGEEAARATAHMHLIGPVDDAIMDSLASAALSRMLDGADGASQR